MAEQKQQILYFTEKAHLAIAKISANYSLEESSKEYMGKIVKDLPSNRTVMIQLAISLAAKKISEKDLVVSLQKGLGVSQEVSEKIAKDIKEQVLPLISNSPESDEEPEEKEETAKETPASTASPAAKPMEEEMDILSPQKTAPALKEKILPKPMSVPTPVKKGNDTYTEPLS